MSSFQQFLSVKIDILKDLIMKITEKNLMTEELSAFFDTQISDVAEVEKKEKVKLRKEKSVVKEKRPATPHQLRVGNSFVVLKERYAHVAHRYRMGAAQFMAAYIRDNEKIEGDDQENDAILHAIEKMNEKHGNIFTDEPVDSDSSSSSPEEKKKLKAEAKAAKEQAKADTKAVKEQLKADAKAVKEQAKIAKKSTKNKEVPIVVEEVPVVVEQVPVVVEEVPVVVEQVPVVVEQVPVVVEQVPVVVNKNNKKVPVKEIEEEEEEEEEETVTRFTEVEEVEESDEEDEDINGLASESDEE
jgi:hypothetical protein